MRYFPSISYNKLTSCLAIAIALLLSACSDSNDFVYIDDDENGEMSFVLSDENGNAQVIPSGTQIGIYMIGNDGTTTFQQVKVDEDGNIILTASARGKQIVAYSPYQEEWGEDVLATAPVFQVQTDQSSLSSYNASDLMIGSAVTTSDETNASISFQHMMAKVVIHIIDDSGVIDLQQVSAELLNVFNSVNVDIKNVKVTTIEETTTDIQMYPEMVTDWRLSSYAILPPQTIAANTDFFAITVYGVRQVYALPEPVLLGGGQTYTINMRLTDQGLVLDGSYVTDWEEESAKTIDVKT